MPYEVGQLPRVLEEIHALEQKAIAVGRRQQYVATLQMVIDNLLNDPLTWGDPEYHPKKQGSCVYHGICDDLFVQYAVYEPEKSVLVLKIKPMPNSPLS